MFVPHARVHISGVPHNRMNKSRPVRQLRRKVGVKEILRMPCLLPTILVVFLGLVVLVGECTTCTYATFLGRQGYKKG